MRGSSVSLHHRRQAISPATGLVLSCSMSCSVSLRVSWAEQPPSKPARSASRAAGRHAQNMVYPAAKAHAPLLYRGAC